VTGSNDPSASSPDEPVQRSALERFVPLLLLGTYGAFCLTLWLGAEWLSSWDSAVYLLTGRSLAEGGGYVYHDIPYALRPPGFSWVLSFFLADGAFDPGAINAFVMACAAAAVAAVFFVFRRVHGTWIALAAALLSGTSPAFVANFNRILSEYPFQLLLFAGFGFVLASDERRRRWWVLAGLAGVALGLAMWFRSVAVLVLPGIFVAGLMRSDRWRWWAGALLPCVLVIGLALPWISWSKTALTQASVPSEQWLLYDYATAMLHVDPGDPASDWVTPGGFVERVVSNGGDLASELAWTCAGTRAVPVRIVVMLALLLGWVLSVMRRPTVLDWFAAVYTVLLLTYFTYSLRLVLPLMPFVPLYLLVLLQRVKLTGRAAAVSAVAVGVVALSIGNARTLSDSLHPELQNEGRFGYRWADNETLATWVEQNTAEDAILMCRRAPELAFLTGRRVYTHRFPRAPGMLERYDIDYVIVDAMLPAELRSEIESTSRRRWTLRAAAPGKKLVVHKLR
jgi:4-amino-4-deoxy-L-arabinose transferase-like glycosyltransferase